MASKLYINKVADNKKRIYELVRKVMELLLDRVKP